MAEAAAGRALRLWQVAGVLLLGWAAGRLPALLSDSEAEAERLRGGAIGDAPAVAATDPDLAARIAAAVASQVAAETVSRLVAAGWGPAGQPAAGSPSPAQPPTQPPTQSVVRIVHESAGPPPGAAGWVLQPMGAPPPPAAPAPPPAPDPASPLPTAEAPPPAPRREEAFALATGAYQALAAGRRREAADGLSRAIALDPEAPQASAWSKDLKSLTRHLSLGAFALVRNGSAGDPLAASPILGSSVTGASIGYTLDPLARRRIAIIGRFATGAGPTGSLDPETSEAAIGVQLSPIPRANAHVAVERRFALGEFARNAWSARIAGGTGGQFHVGRFPAAWDVYGEGGVIGVSEPDLYAGAQARALIELLRTSRIRIDAGAGAWAAGQDAFVTSHRFDIGPTLAVRFDGLPMSASIDYRIKAAGNAEPGSGVALTIAGEF
jgi:hypothetical protein